MTVGVVAIQGDFEKHIEALHRLENPNVSTRELRIPEDLQGVDRVIVPGGESTAVGLLMQRYGLGNALIERAQAGMPVWGTCMGMILLATDIADRPSQYSLNLLDIEVTRNAFGAQVHSFEGAVTFAGLESPINGVFIRAPVVTKRGEAVETLALYDGKIVAVRQGKILGTSFHPELTPDTRLHEWFLSL